MIDINSNSTSAANKRIAKNSVFMSVRMVIVLAITLYTTRAVLGALGVEDYGIYNVVCGFVSMFSFLTTSMSNGIQRYFNFEYGKNGVDGANRVYNAALIIQFFVLLLSLLLCETVGLWYINNKLVVPESRLFAANCVFQLSLFSFCCAIMQVPYMAAIMAHEKMNIYAYVSTFDAVLKLAIAISISLFPYDGLIVYGILISLISLIDILIYYAYCKSKFEEIKISSSSSGLTKSMLSFSSWNILGTITGILREQGINVLLNLFFGAVINAARGVTYQVLSALQGFVGTLMVSVRPQIVQSYSQGNIKRSLSLMGTISKASFLVLYIMAYPIAIEADYILAIWLGDNVPNYTNIFLRLVIIVAFINNLNGAVSAVVHATGKMKLYQITGCLSTIMVLPTAYIWLKCGGTAVDVFYICIVFAVIMQTLAVWVLSRLVEFPMVDYFKLVIRPILLTICFSFAFPFIAYHYITPGLLRLIIIACISTISACLAMYAVGLSSQEKLYIKSFLNKIKSRI